MCEVRRECRLASNFLVWELILQSVCNHAILAVFFSSLSDWIEDDLEFWNLNYDCGRYGRSVWNVSVHLLHWFSFDPEEQLELIKVQLNTYSSRRRSSEWLDDHILAIESSGLHSNFYVPAVDGANHLPVVDSSLKGYICQQSLFGLKRFRV